MLDINDIGDEDKKGRSHTMRGSIDEECLEGRLMILPARDLSARHVYPPEGGWGAETDVATLMTWLLRRAMHWSGLLVGVVEPAVGPRDGSNDHSSGDRCAPST